MADRAGFEEFVALRSPRLLRVCYLLTRDAMNYTQLTLVEVATSSAAKGEA